MYSNKWDTARCTNKIVDLAGLLEGAGRRRVLILCHNNPDPDSIGGAFGFQFLLKKKFGIRSVIGYGGMITRAENKAMVQRLRIKMLPLSRLDPSKYFAIALIDSQPGTGNNLLTQRQQPPMVVIDHHPLRKLSLKATFRDIRPSYGATSTIVTEYLATAEVTPSRSVANALLYGIKTDTNSLVRGASKADFWAFNYLSPLTNPRMLALIENPALPLKYFEEFQRGLSSTTIYRDVAVSRLGKIETETIIPELADLLLRIDGVSWVLCLGEKNNLMLMSLRSTARLQKAGNVIRRVIGKLGSGGGHKSMAGGQVRLENLSAQERLELPDKLVSRFLKIVDREACHPRPVVETDAPEASQRCIFEGNGREFTVPLRKPSRTGSRGTRLASHE